MGLGYGLVQGLLSGARGIQQGKSDARALEQKALHDALARKLLEAQINKLNAPPPVPQQEYTYHADPETGEEVIFNPQTGERQIIKGQRTPRPQKPVAPTPGSPEALRIIEEETKARARGAPDRPQSQAEVAAADQLPIIEESYKTLEEIESRDPTIGNRVIAKANQARQFSVGKVVGGIIGKYSGTRSDEDQKALTEQAIVNSLTPEEARWYAAQKGFLSGVLPALGGKNLTINEVITHGAPMFSVGEESAESLAQKRAARRGRYEATRKRGTRGAAPTAPASSPPAQAKTYRKGNPFK